MMKQLSALPVKMLWKFYSLNSARINKFSTFMDLENHRKLQAVSEQIRQATGGRASRLIERVSDIQRIVETIKPRRVVEIGSGRSSVALALLSLKHNFVHDAFEQDQEWEKLINGFIGQTGAAHSHVAHAPLRLFKEGGYLEHEIKDCDFLYIDGPWVEKGEHKTFTGKPAYYDVLNYFEKGIFPKAILIEGRTDTVDLILNSPHGSKYKFCGEAIWAAQRGNVVTMARLKRHSFFILK